MNGSEFGPSDDGTALSMIEPACGYPGPNVNCGCEYHLAWVRANPTHPEVVADRARTIAWMAEHPGFNPATGHPLAHPDDYLVEVYGVGADVDELVAMGLVV